MTARLAGLRPGETLYLDEIRAACIAPYATQIYKIAFASITLDGANATDLTADIVPAGGRALRLRSVTFVDGKATP